MRQKKYERMTRLLVKGYSYWVKAGKDDLEQLFNRAVWKARGYEVSTWEPDGVSLTSARHP
jgi:hypothetical protein